MYKINIKNFETVENFKLMLKIAIRKYDVSKNYFYIIGYSKTKRNLVPLQMQDKAVDRHFSGYFHY